jgi:hypothetical protein
LAQVDSARVDLDLEDAVAVDQVGLPMAAPGMADLRRMAPVRRMAIGQMAIDLIPIARTAIVPTRIEGTAAEIVAVPMVLRASVSAVPAARADSVVPVAASARRVDLAAVAAARLAKSSRPTFPTN